MERTLISDLPKNISKTVTIKGWVDTIREHGSLIFIDLRDRYGKVQCVAHKKISDFEKIKSLSVESCIALTGLVKERPKGTEKVEYGNLGSVELSIENVEVYTITPLLPFELKRDDVNEDIRLKYRYLDLRSPNMQNNLILRGKIIQKMREYLYSKNFVEIETPFFGKSTPEGARDYIVPSRTQPGKFYALPQSPQLYKQLLMVAGMEKYFQVARCMRDEDLRADRQPEFTQLDVEMSFVKQEDIFEVVEGVIKHVFKEIFNLEIKTPFSRLSYKDAMEKYNSDKPDLRKNKLDKNEFAFSWVVDFPLLEFDKEEKRFVACHHPFCMPKDPKDLEKDPSKAIAQTYDLVLNGVELLSGSIRIHDSKIQEKVFELLKINKEEQQEKFGFLLEALRFGAPPHGGFAIGLDRLIQIMVGASSIREVIAFPKNKEARDLMTEAPSEVNSKQLKEVHISIDLPKEKIVKKK